MSTSSVTPNIGLQVPATGSNNWYIPLNYNLNKLDQILGGQIPIANLNVTNLTVANFALNAANITTALGYTPLNPANNLADIANASQSLTNLGAVGISSLQGAYNGGVTYNQAAIVTDAGASYISLVNNNTGNDPTTSPTFWALFSASGGSGIGTLIGDVTASGSGTVTATVVGINSIVLSDLGAGILAIDGSGVPLLAVAGTDYIAPGGAAVVASLTLGSGANEYHFVAPGGAALEIVNAASTAAIVASGVGTTYNFGVSVISPTFAQVGLTLLVQNSGGTALGEGAVTVQTNSADFLSNTNTAELQLGVEGSGSEVTSLALGDVTTTIANTNIALLGSINLNGVVISGTPTSGDTLVATGTNAAAWSAGGGGGGMVYPGAGIAVSTGTAWDTSLPVIASVQIALPTSAIAANTATTAATVSMPGVTSTTALKIAFASDPTSVAGWGTGGGLVFVAWCTTDTLNWRVINQTSLSITPGAINLNVGA